MTAEQAYEGMFENYPVIQEDQIFPAEYLEPLSLLWKDRGIQSVVQRGNEAALPEKYVHLSSLNFCADDSSVVWPSEFNRSSYAASGSDGATAFMDNWKGCLKFSFRQIKMSCDVVNGLQGFSRHALSPLTSSTGPSSLSRLRLCSLSKIGCSTSAVSGASGRNGSSRGHDRRGVLTGDAGFTASRTSRRCSSSQRFRVTTNV